MNKNRTLEEFLDNDAVQDYLETVHNFDDVAELKGVEEALRRFLGTISPPLLRRLRSEVVKQAPPEHTPTWELLQWMEDVIRVGSEDDQPAVVLPETVVMI